MRMYVAVSLLVCVSICGQLRAAPNDTQGFYSAAQAKRGEMVFTHSCRACHTVNAKEPGDSLGGPLAGGVVLRKWRTVGDLYIKIRRTMPGDNVGGLSVGSYLDVLAFILQANGLPAGSSELPRDTQALHKLLLATETSKAQPGAMNLAEGRFYTEEQAKRGEGYFLGNCVTCHTTNPGGPSEKDRATGRKGWLRGGTWSVVKIGGPDWLRRYPSVFSLFNKVQQTMPAHDPHSLSMDTYLDITAYFLKVAGAPSGTAELQYNLNLMKSMMLNEPGFEQLFNGKDFSGIQFVLGNNCTPHPAGCGQTTPGDAFHVEDGTIISSGSPEGYWYADKKYLNFTLRFDFRYQRPAVLETDDDFLGNSGYLLFITEHGVWPKTIEIQGANGMLLYAFGVGTEIRATYDAEARKKVIKPVGQWNSVEIASKDGQVRSYLNGTLISTVTEHEFKQPGYIGFQSEGGAIQWRNIRIKEE